MAAARTDNFLGERYRRLARRRFDVDHVVPLEEAWTAVPVAWTAAKPTDDAETWATPSGVSASSNRSKGDRCDGNDSGEGHLLEGPQQDAFGPPFQLLGGLEQAGLPPEHLQGVLIWDLLVGLHVQAAGQLELPLPDGDRLWDGVCERLIVLGRLRRGGRGVPVAVRLPRHHEQCHGRQMAQLVVITGPIAAGKNTVASLIADGLTALGRLAVLVDVDDVAAMVAGPGAAAAGLWFAAHHAHGALVGTWMQTPVDVVIAVGPIYTPREQAALLHPLPEASAVHWVVIDAPVAVTLARAQADPGRELSREPGFHGEAHQRFRQLLPQIPVAQTFDSAQMSAEQIAGAVLDAIGIQ